MALRNILQIGDPVLRKKSFAVTDFGEKTAELLDDLKDTLKSAGGVGLAAPQVGVLRRIFIVDYEDKLYECVNPVITERKGSCEDTEGCLSVRGKYGTVARPTKITVKFQDRTGKPVTMKIQGYLARIFCHEYDHLDGVLYVDIAKNVGEDRA